jgi:hypothetical protein
VPPRVVETPVGHIDLLPTVLNAVRGHAEPQLLGRSLLPLMLGAADPEPDAHVFQEVWYEGPTSRKAAVTRAHHLIRNLVPDDTTELYDLLGDPEEEHDLAGTDLAAERSLAGLLAAWMDRAALPANFKERVAGNVTRTPISARTPLGDVIGGVLELVGVDVATPAVRPGGQAELAIVLHGLGRVPAGWRLFTHLTSGGRMINADHEPVEGLFPLARVRRGTWLRDRLRVSVPAGWPRGPLTVEVGLWRGAERMPAEGPHVRAGVVTVATLQVTP